MILSALNDYYERLAEQERVPLSGFSSEKISYALVFSAKGKPLQIDDLRITDGKQPRAQLLKVPVDKRRTQGIHAYPLWDKTAYSLGVTSGEGKRIGEEHSAFIARQKTIFCKSDDAELSAFLAFVDCWQPSNLVTLPGYNDDMLDKNFVFRLDGTHHYLHEHAPARQLWLEALEEVRATTSILGPCLVTGERLPLGTGHPAIRNVENVQGPGASLVSFNSSAYESFGHKGQANASISQRAIFSYATALNYLLRKENNNHQRLTIGDATVVFWARAANHAQAEAAEQFFFKVLNEPPTDEQEAARLKTALDQVAQGTALNDTDVGIAGDTQFYVLGLAPNAARLSVRYWCVDTLDQFTQHIALHHQDMALEPKPTKNGLPPIWRLVNATAPYRDGRPKAKDVAPQLAGEMMRAVLTGQRYPQSLLTNLVMRFRNDGVINGIRIALCKAVLTRNTRLSQHSNNSSQEVPVSLDRQSTHPGYLLGRLFAELENAQERAIPNTNATVRDRYYGAASATPASVFPMLLRNVQNHLSKLRKGGEKDKAIAGAITRNMREIVDGLEDHFLKSLKIEDQGRFAIGYYHQSQARFVRRADGEDTETKKETTKEGDPA